MPDHICCSCVTGDPKPYGGGTDYVAPETTPGCGPQGGGAIIGGGESCRG